MRSSRVSILHITLIVGLLSSPAGSALGQDPPPDDVSAGVRIYLPMQARFAGPPRGQTPTRTPTSPGNPGPTPTGTPTPGDPPISGETVPSPFGVAMFDNVDPRTGLPQMSNAGAGWVMTNIRWVDIEPIEGQAYDFSISDAKIDSIAAAGMKPFVLFDHNPDWAMIASGAIRAPVRPEKMDALYRVTRAVAERYNGRNGHGRVDYWMYYGEPDNISAWGERASDYADALAVIGPQVKGVNVNARVMIGALAYDWFTTDASRGPFRRDFLDGVLARLNTKPGGATAYLDAITFNYFDISGWRWPTIIEKTAEIRQIMAARNVSELPVIITEMGRSSRLGGRDETDVQARWLVQSYVRGLSIGVAQMHWFQVFDMEPATYEKDYGLFVRSNLYQPKPAYAAYAALTYELDQAAYDTKLTVPGVEGYVFWQSSERKAVVWGSGTAAVSMTLRQTCSRIVSRQGEVSQFLDGGTGDQDGAVNGTIQIQVQPNEPIYIGACP